MDQTSKDGQNAYANSDLTIEEIALAIKDMQYCKSDGIPAKFHKIYLSYLKDDLSKIHTKGMQDKELAHSQHLAVIYPVYKKSTGEDITNWRLISLLNVDYEISSKTWAIRIRYILPPVIHED